MKVITLLPLLGLGLGLPVLYFLVGLGGVILEEHVLGLPGGVSTVSTECFLLAALAEDLGGILANDGWGCAMLCCI